MKKTLLIICMFLVSAIVFAAPSKMPEAQSVTIKVVGIRDDSGTFDIGFSSNSVGQWSVLPIHINGDNVPLKTKFLADGSVIGELPHDKLYVYWRVLNRKRLILSLAQDGPMMNQGSVLHWKASWLYDDKTITLDSHDGGDKYETLHICQELINMESIGGSTSISITTEPLEGKMATGSYKGNLKLKIELVK